MMTLLALKVCEEEDREEAGCEAVVDIIDVEGPALACARSRSASPTILSTGADTVGISNSSSVLRYTMTLRDDARQ